MSPSGLQDHVPVLLGGRAEQQPGGRRGLLAARTVSDLMEGNSGVHHVILQAVQLRYWNGDESDKLEVPRPALGYKQDWYWPAEGGDARDDWECGRGRGGGGKWLHIDRQAPWLPGATRALADWTWGAPPAEEGGCQVRKTSNPMDQMFNRLPSVFMQLLYDIISIKRARAMIAWPGTGSLSSRRAKNPFTGRRRSWRCTTAFLRGSNCPPGGAFIKSKSGLQSNTNEDHIFSRLQRARRPVKYKKQQRRKRPKRRRHFPPRHKQPTVRASGKKVFYSEDRKKGVGRVRGRGTSKKTEDTGSPWKWNGILGIMKGFRGIF